ncbi:MAG: cobalamin biosynthesis protein CobQ [Firmicutes bacterium]|nr:cobalamin biosynthesis protein CobQ [Bacillota bacterium]
MTQFKIGWLFPDTLYIHGERGNVLAFERFAKMAGLEPVIEKIDFDTKDFDPMNYDVIFCPPGELVSYPVILDWMRPYKEGFEAFVEAGKPMLVTGTSIALWGETVTRVDGSSFEGMGLVKVDTKENEKVYGDDNYFTCTYNGVDIEIIGNQIQMVDFINKGETAFGRLYYGYGNTGKDLEEGFQKKNAIFTNTLAPMLVVNPKLTMEMIKVAAAAKGVEIPEFTFDDELEQKSFATKKEFIQTKVTRLTNHL